MCRILNSIHMQTGPALLTVAGQVSSTIGTPPTYEVIKDLASTFVDNLKMKSFNFRKMAKILPSTLVLVFLCFINLEVNFNGYLQEN